MNPEHLKKLTALTDEIYPILLDRLKNEGHFAPAGSVKKQKNISLGGVYYPEIDYIIHSTRMRGEFRKARYTAGTTLKMEPRDPSLPSYGLEVFGGSEAPGYEHTLRKHIIVPSAALHRDLSEPYGVLFKQDYRVIQNGSRTYYVKGVMDGKTNEPIKTNANCYVVDMLEPVTMNVIYNTRLQWEMMSDYEKGMRVVSEDTMMKVLDLLEAKELTPCAIPWKLEVLSNGRAVQDDDMDSLDGFDWVSPLKIGLGELR